MAVFKANGIEIDAEAFGEATGVPLLLIRGLGTQRTAWPDAFLAGLDYTGARTADPAKHARLGLGGRGEEGEATRVTVRDASGAVRVDILIGRETETGIYVRFPGRNRTYAARPGETAASLPPIAEAAHWLDLDFLCLLYTSPSPRDA